MELRDDVEHQGPADAVEGESLPELGQEIFVFYMIFYFREVG
jgi:hypothetical protein